MEAGQFYSRRAARHFYMSVHKNIPHCQRDVLEFSDDVLLHGHVHVPALHRLVRVKLQPLP